VPYKVSVVDPDNFETKQKIYNKVVGNHRKMEDERKTWKTNSLIGDQSDLT